MDLEICMAVVAWVVVEVVEVVEAANKEDVVANEDR